MAMNAAFQVMLHIKKHLIFLPVSFFITKNVYICKDVIKFYFLIAFYDWDVTKHILHN